MKIGFIGCGNMGGALAMAVSRAAGAGDQLWLSDQDFEKAEQLARLADAKATDSAEIVKDCEIVVLGVKPQMLRGLMVALEPVLRARKTLPLLVTMAAGVSLATLEGMLGFACPMIRIMPNTPVSVGEGRVLYALGADVNETQKNDFLRLFAKVGTLHFMAEGLIDAGSALSGCGPAFVYLFIEAMADGAVAAGLPRQTALELAAGTVLGSAKMVLETGKHPGELKDAVCSPAGTTIAGVAALEQGAFRGTVMDAVIKAYEKTRELGKK